MHCVPTTAPLEPFRHPLLDRAVGALVICRGE
jgi:hypothetical protein